jgi:hypothetical protein
MRDKMPIVAAFIDQLREAFGREGIDQAIRSGMRDGTFHARENGHEVGAPVKDEPGRTVRLSDMSPYNDHRIHHECAREE